MRMLGSDRFGFMAIQLSKKQSDLEKRLKILHQQVYGKSQLSHLPNTQTSSSPTLIKSDLAFLYQDLLKIGIFASSAIGFQIILFFLIRNHVLNLKLF